MFQNIIISFQRIKHLKSENTNEMIRKEMILSWDIPPLNISTHEETNLQNFNLGFRDTLTQNLCVHGNHENHFKFHFH